MKPFQEECSKEERKRQIKCLPVGMVISRNDQIIRDAHIKKSTTPGWIDVFGDNGKIFSMPASAISKIVWRDDWKNYKGA